MVKAGEPRKVKNLAIIMGIFNEVRDVFVALIHTSSTSTCFVCFVQEVKITQINNACTTASEKHLVLKKPLAFSEPLG